MQTCKIHLEIDFKNLKRLSKKGRHEKLYDIFQTEKNRWKMT